MKLNLYPNQVTSILLFFALFIFAGCVPSKPSFPPAGTLWENEYGYTDVYSVPEEFPEPELGFRIARQYILSRLSKTPCKGYRRLVLQAIIDEEGTVMAVHVHKPVEEACEETGVDAVKKLKFTPATLDGEPVKSVFAFSFKFE
ncbi:energy transducer TonB [Gracilimonas mengyeensis]|uniref:TonB protein C-terminal n=1 Tax=Gracilimonas mengyeensis TaxID=1302730 RepID=A0A521E800_9BACT|nr:energy transducer TonB [Gracilimonas mengyeensis]SMO80039.1 TonB protein C-terminal [Gracilimonas mengyeensis]